MRKILALIFIFFITILQASRPNLEELIWGNGDTLLTFFARNNVPFKVYYDLEREDRELVDEIRAQTKFWILRDSDENLLQALIPISDELQIHISKDKNGNYDLQFLPIEYELEERTLSLKITNYPYYDIERASGSTSLARAFVAAFKGTVDFKSIKKGDRLVIIYTQKRRMGKIFGAIEIQAAMIESKTDIKYAYRFEDAYYDEQARELERFFLITPIKEAKISSHFNPKRFHPVLKKYRAHLGTDYSAPKGTKVYASGDGVISFIGEKGGYGNTIIVQHASNFTSLYAHLSGFVKGLKQGKRVKQGELIGFVGNTGMSTGPHLHFGIYRDNTAVNALKVLKVVRSDSSIRNKEAFKQMVIQNKINFALALSNSYANAPKEEFFSNIIPFD